MGRQRRRTPAKPAQPKHVRQPGDVVGNRVYLPGHACAGQRGWVGAHRLVAFNDRNGVCVCDAGKQAMEWPAAKVVDVDGKLMVLCQMHGLLRWLAQNIVDTRFGGADGERLAVALGALWSAPCPALGGPRFTEDQDALGEDPFGASPPIGQPPATQVEIST